MATNDAEDPTWTLCITRSGSNQRVVLSCPARSTKVAQLQQRAREALGLSSSSVSDPSYESKTEEEGEQWHVNGVPRRLLTRDQWCLSLMDAGIRHQDRISVTIPESVASKTKKKEATDASSTQRSKRKAAVAATESFAAATKFEEEIAAPKRKRAVPASGRAPSVAQHFRQLSSNASPGRRLCDGSEVQVAARRRRQKLSTVNVTANKTTLEEGLVAATSDHSSAARLMRQGWRQAVQSAYEQNQAASRVAAAQNLSSPKIKFELLNASTDDSSIQQLQQLHITYPKGIQGRGTFTDVVDYLPHDLVVAAVKSLYPSEALRSSHLALLSPRVFWSLLYHFYQHRQNTDDSDVFSLVGRGDVVHAALQWSCPSCDWSYLRRRPEQLSAKASENQRQKQQQNAAVDWEAAAAAISDVETAMEHMWENATSNGRTSGAVGFNEVDSWAIITPTEEDLDELRECILEAKSDSAKLDTDYVENVVQALSQRCSIRNWRELANAEVANLYTQLRATLSENQMPFSAADVEAWIDQAQSRSLEEIMVEICDGDVQALEGLRDGARSGTPTDLAIWESIPGALLQHLKATVPDRVFTEADLQRWCRRARQSMEQLEWLADYVSPIEDVSGE